MSTDTQNNAPVSSERAEADERKDFAKWYYREYGKSISTFCKFGHSDWNKTEQKLFKVWAARAALFTPAATQPDVTQQTLDDVIAGIPARDAEIEALRKEIETLRAQQDTDRVNALPPLNDDLIAILGRPNFMCAQLADTLRSGGHAIAERAENEQAAVIHFLLGHYLVDPVQWAEKASAVLKAARKEQA
ncbi:hypothetical protein E5C31_11415 [Providencia rettgeri]|nr:hypothetical protein [Providencia rettgeri]